LWHFRIEVNILILVFNVPSKPIAKPVAGKNAMRRGLKRNWEKMFDDGNGFTKLEYKVPTIVEGITSWFVQVGRCWGLIHDVKDFYCISNISGLSGIQVDVLCTSQKQIIFL